MGIGILIKILGIPINKGTPNKDFNFGNQPRDLIITIQTNSPNIDPDLQVKFSLLVTQQVDNTKVVATFDSIKSLYSNISSQYVKES